MNRELIVGLGDEDEDNSGTPQRPGGGLSSYDPHGPKRAA